MFMMLQNAYQECQYCNKHADLHKPLSFSWLNEDKETSSSKKQVSCYNEEKIPDIQQSQHKGQGAQNNCKQDKKHRNECGSPFPEDDRKGFQTSLPVAFHILYRLRYLPSCVCKEGHH